MILPARNEMLSEKGFFYGDSIYSLIATLIFVISSFISVHADSLKPFNQTKLIGTWCLQSCLMAGKESVDLYEWTFMPNSKFTLISGSISKFGHYSISDTGSIIAGDYELQNVEIIDNQMKADFIGECYFTRDECIEPKIDYWLDLHIAIRKGSLAKVKSIIPRHISPQLFDPEDQWERTPLHLAAKYKQFEVAEYLLSVEASPNSEDATGKTPSRYAIKANSPRILDLIVSKGGNPNAADSEQRSLLFWAIGQNNLAMVDLLLKAGANKDILYKHPFEGTLHSLLNFAKNKENIDPNIIDRLSN